MVSVKSVEVDTSSPSPVAPSIVYRPNQKETVDAIANLFRNGKRLVFLDAPVGSGKSLINLLVSNLSSGGASITSPQVALVDQYKADVNPGGKFEGLAATISGRSNYPCPHVRMMPGGDPKATAEGAPCTFVKYWPYGHHAISGRSQYDEYGHRIAESLDGHHCISDCVDGCPVFLAHECPYYNAKFAAQEANVVVTTLAYQFEAISRFDSLLGLVWGNGWHSRRLLVVDEAHSFDEDLVSFFSMELRPSTLPGFPFDSIPKPELMSADESLGFLRERLPPYFEIQKEALEAMVVSDEAETVAERFAYQKDVKGQMRVVRTAAKMMLSLARENIDWVHTYDDPKDERGAYHPVHMWRPLTVGPLVKDAWEQIPLVLLSSATFLDVGRLAVELGFPKGSWATVTVPDTFPKRSAPIRLESVMSLNKRNLMDSVPNIVAYIEHIAKKHPDSRGIVHGHSYQLAKAISERATGYLRSRLVFHDKQSRNATYQDWKSKKAEAPDSILVGVGMNEGIDLPYDHARFQIIIKTPYPSMGDPWVVARKDRLADGQKWYDEATLMGILQASGRIMRAQDDSGVTYILDSNVNRLVSAHWMVLPQWFKDRVAAGYDEIRWERDAKA